MTTLTIDADGQITLTDELLRHLGLGAGDQLQVDFVPDGTLYVEPLRPSRRKDLIDTFDAVHHPSQ